MAPAAVRADLRRSCCSYAIVFTVFMDGLSPLSTDVQHRSNTRGPATAGPLDESVDSLLWLDDGDSTLDRRVDLWICLDVGNKTVTHPFSGRIDNLDPLQHGIPITAGG